MATANLSQATSGNSGVGERVAAGGGERVAVGVRIVIAVVVKATIGGGVVDALAQLVQEQVIIRIMIGK